MATKRLATNSPDRDFTHVLQNLEDFDTRGALYGRNNPPALTGWLPEEFRESFRASAYAVFSHVTPIAWKTSDGWVMPSRKYSQTTSRYQNKIRAALRQFTEYKER